MALRITSTTRQDDDVNDEKARNDDRCYELSYENQVAMKTVSRTLEILNVNSVYQWQVHLFSCSLRIRFLGDPTKGESILVWSRTMGIKRNTERHRSATVRFSSLHLSSLQCVEQSSKYAYFFIKCVTFRRNQSLGATEPSSIAHCRTKRIH